MTVLKAAAAAALVFGAMTVSAGATTTTTFVFKGAGLNTTPLGIGGVDFEEDCATVGDICTIDHALGLNYERDGIDLKVIAYADGLATRLIQDIHPSDSGLGAFSEDNRSDDQTQADSNEAIEFTFDRIVKVTDVEFNAGGDRNCTAAAAGGGEGTCGEFRLDIFDLSDALIASTVIDITNTDILADLGEGARFLLTALTSGSGFTVAQFTVSNVPVPAALPLLVSGIAGLGFATRRKKKVA